MSNRLQLMNIDCDSAGEGCCQSNWCLVVLLCLSRAVNCTRAHSFFKTRQQKGGHSCTAALGDHLNANSSWSSRPSAPYQLAFWTLWACGTGPLEAKAEFVSRLSSLCALRGAAATNPPGHPELHRAEDSHLAKKMGRDSCWTLPNTHQGCPNVWCEMLFYRQI